MSYNPLDPFGIGKSKARRALLGLFFTNPDREYFPRQLERLTAIYVANLQRELVRLEGAEILESRRLGKLKLYKLNRKHPLYSELKSLVSKTIGLQEVIRGELSAVPGIEAACIYGSFARGDERPSSDVDLLILGAVSEKALIRVARGLEKTLQREINYTLYTAAEWERRKSASDPFVQEVLRQPRIPLLGEPDAIR